MILLLYWCLLDESEWLNCVLIRFIMAELLQTEQTYVKDLEICIKYYYNALRNQSSEFKAQSGLVNKEDVLFSNMKDVLEFHKDIFLKELQKYEAMPEDVGHCFVTWVLPPPTTTTSISFFFFFFFFFFNFFSIINYSISFIPNYAYYC